MPFGPLIVFLCASLALIFSPAPVLAETPEALPPEDTRPVIRIGLIAPFSGPIAYIGENIARWQFLALEELSQDRDAHYRIEVIPEDDQFQPRQTILAARRLDSTYNVHALLSYSSPAGSALAPVANSLKIPHIAVAYDPRAAVGEYNMVNTTPAADHVPAFIDLLNHKGYKNVAILAVRNSTWQPALDALHKAADAGAFNLVHERIYQPGERDFRLGIQQIPDTADALLLLSWSPEINIIGRQLKEMDVELPLLGLCGGLSFSSERSLFLGGIDVAYGDMRRPNEINKELTGQPIANAAGTMIYDEILMIADVCESLYDPAHPDRTPTRDQINDALHQIEKVDDSMLGPLTRVGKNYKAPIYFYRIDPNGFSILPLEEL